jgi:hypothetical protein
MTRKQRLTKIALRQSVSADVNMFLGNMPSTVIANDYTRTLAAYANAVLIKAYDSNKLATDVLNINANLQ